MSGNPFGRYGKSRGYVRGVRFMTPRKRKHARNTSRKRLQDRSKYNADGTLKERKQGEDEGG